LFIINAAVASGKWQDLRNDFPTNRPIEDQHLQTAIAIDTFNLISATIDREVIQVRWLNPKHHLKRTRLHPTKAGALFINPTFTVFMVKINTPTILAHHAEIQRQPIGRQIFRQIRSIGRIKLTASTAILHTLPSRHSQTPSPYLKSRSPAAQLIQT
jgi:hypothetical protein